MNIGPTWQGTVKSVADWERDRPEISMHLSGTYNMPGKGCLPRAGEVYWLIDERTFRTWMGEPTDPSPE